MSNATFSITTSGDLLQRAAKLAQGDVLITRLARVLKEENALTVAHIQQDYMSFPKDQPPTMDGLRAQSNRLRNSIRAADVETEGGKLNSGIGSNVVYAAIQEFGGQTSAHDIVARNAEALAFIPGAGGGGSVPFKMFGPWITPGQFSKADLLTRIKGIRGNARKAAKADYFKAQGVVFLKRVHHPGSDMPARQYIQRGIEDRLPDYTIAFNGEIQKVIVE